MSVTRASAAAFGFVGAGSAIALWIGTIPSASGWSSSNGALLLLLIGALAIVGLLGAFTALRRPGLALPLLAIPGGFHLVYPWGAPGLAMLIGAAFCIWEIVSSSRSARLSR